MHYCWLCLLVGGLGWSAAPAATDDPRAIIAKALAAAGGKLTDKDRALTWSETGVFHLMGQQIKYQMQWSFVSATQWRFDFEGIELPVKIKVVMNGPRAWQAAAGQVEEIKDEKLGYVKHQGYVQWLSTLYPLLEKPEFKLSQAGELEVEGKPAVGVRVSHPEHEEVTLYFDKATHLLVGAETTVLNEFAGWAKAKQSTRLLDYKTVGGRQVFTRIKVIRDDQPLLESTLSDHKRHERLEAVLFAEPQP